MAFGYTGKRTTRAYQLLASSVTMFVSVTALRGRELATDTSTSETPRRTTLFPCGSRMNRPETLSQGVLIAWAIPVGKARLESKIAITNKETNNECNVTLRVISFSFCPTSYT